VTPRPSLVAGDNVARERLQGLRPVAVGGEGGASLLDQRVCPRSGSVEAEKRDEGRLARIGILAERLARRRAVAGDVEDVVRDLEGEADGAGIGRERAGIGAAQDRARLRRPFDQRPVLLP
jgi:hypothetical protein